MKRASSLRVFLISLIFLNARLALTMESLERVPLLSVLIPFLADPANVSLIENLESKNPVQILEASGQVATMMSRLPHDVASCKHVCYISRDIDDRVKIDLGPCRRAQRLEIIKSVILFEINHPSEIALLRGSAQKKYCLETYEFIEFLLRNGENIKSEYSVFTQQSHASTSIDGLLEESPLLLKITTFLPSHGDLTLKIGNQSQIPVNCNQECSLAVINCLISQTIYDALYKSLNGVMNSIASEFFDSVFLDYMDALLSKLSPVREEILQAERPRAMGRTGSCKDLGEKCLLM